MWHIGSLQTHVLESYLSVSFTELIDKARQEDQSTCQNVGWRSFALQEVRLATIRDQKRKLKGDPNFTDFPWEDTSKFDPNWIEFVKKNYDKVMIPPSAMSENRNWLELVPNVQNPELSRYLFRIKTNRLISHVLKIRWIAFRHRLFRKEWKDLHDLFVISSEEMMSSEEMSKQFDRLNKIKVHPMFRLEWTTFFSFVINVPTNIFSFAKFLARLIFKIMKNNFIFLFFHLFN